MYLLFFFKSLLLHWPEAPITYFAKLQLSTSCLSLICRRRLLRCSPWGRVFFMGGKMSRYAEHVFEWEIPHEPFNFKKNHQSLEFHVTGNHRFWTHPINSKIVKYVNFINPYSIFKAHVYSINPTVHKGLLPALGPGLDRPHRAFWSPVCWLTCRSCQPL